MSEYSSGGNYMPARFAPKRRQYKPCLKCKQPTFANNQICTDCDPVKAASRAKLHEYLRQGNN